MLKPDICLSKIQSYGGVNCTRERGEGRYWLVQVAMPISCCPGRGGGGEGRNLSWEGYSR